MVVRREKAIEKGVLATLSMPALFSMQTILTLCFLRLLVATLLTGPFTQGRRKALFSIQQRRCWVLCSAVGRGWWLPVVVRVVRLLNRV